MLTYALPRYRSPAGYQTTKCEAPTRRTRGSPFGEVIGNRGIDEVPGALVPGHGPFTWGENVREALERAVTLEEIAGDLAFLTVVLRPDVAPLPATLVDRHFTRKHGPGAYYGQLP